MADKPPTTCAKVKLLTQPSHATYLQIKSWSELVGTDSWLKQTFQHKSNDLSRVLDCAIKSSFVCEIKSVGSWGPCCCFFLAQIRQGQGTQKCSSSLFDLRQEVCFNLSTESDAIKRESSKALCAHWSWLEKQGLQPAVINICQASCRTYASAVVRLCMFCKAVVSDLRHLEWNNYFTYYKLRM